MSYSEVAEQAAKYAQRIMELEAENESLRVLVQARDVECDALRAYLARARAVLESAVWQGSTRGRTLLDVDDAAWQAWREGQK